MYNIAGCIWWLHKTALFVQVSYSDTFLVICMTIKYRVFMMESTKSKQLLWDFLLKDHMISWVNLIGIKRPFCETKSDFWYSEIIFSVHFGDISKGYPLEKCQNHHLLFEKLFHISKWPIKAFLKINFNLTLLYEKCPKYGSRCGQ